MCHNRASWSVLSVPYTGLSKRDRTEAEHEAHMAGDAIVLVNLIFLENLSSYDTWSCLLLIRQGKIR